MDNIRYIVSICGRYLYTLNPGTILILTGVIMGAILHTKAV